MRLEIKIFKDKLKKRIFSIRLPRRLRLIAEKQLSCGKNAVSAKKEIAECNDL